jgi:hypothetical protein
MINFLKKIYFWCYIKVHTMIIAISIALYNTEQEILKADPNDLDEKNKRETRKLHRNQTLEKFYAGKTDEKYVKDYYEILKKADKFIRTATPRQMALAADKHGMSYGMKDPQGRVYEHYGFYDEKHKNAGKTMAEVLLQEYKERRTMDDDYELLYIFNNKPIEVGLANIMDVLEKPKDDNAEFEYQVVDMFKKSKQFEFPIKAVRENQNAVNKIEQLSEFLHVKKIGFEYRQLEFFIPLKFRTNDFAEDSNIFKEIIDIKEVYIKDEYGTLRGFGIIKYIKRIIYNDTHEVLKFDGIEMENVGIH